MQAFKVLRFVFLGVGLALVPLGIVVLTTMKPSGSPGTAVFSAIGIALLGVSLLVVGGGLLIASVIMFIKYAKGMKKIEK